MRAIREIGAGGLAIAALLALSCGRTGAVAAGTVGPGSAEARSVGAGTGAGGFGSSAAGGSAAVASVDGRAASEHEEAPGGGGVEPLRLVLRAALPLDVEADDSNEFQPSGLLLHEGRLLTVSDKHDRAIYGIDIGSDHARVSAFVHFEPPADTPPPLDFEGLSPAPGGGWLVASEAQRRVLHVQLDPSSAVSEGVSAPVWRARWYSSSLGELDRTSGCLQKINAGLEGVAISGQGRLVLAGEREPRCLIELDAADDQTTAGVWLMESSAYASKPGRHLDYSDLTIFHGALYALVRNSHLIVRLERTPEGWREGPPFSYRDAEHDPRYIYEDPTFGMAEGVAIDEQRVYIVLDNNEHARAVDGRDRRPILFIFDRPPTL